MTRYVASLELDDDSGEGVLAVVGTLYEGLKATTAVKVRMLTVEEMAP